jgi:hypothetical protein
MLASFTHSIHSSPQEVFTEHIPHPCFVSMQWLKIKCDQKKEEAIMFLEEPQVLYLHITLVFWFIITKSYRISSVINIL